MQISVIVEYQRAAVDDTEASIEKKLTFSDQSNTTLCQDNSGTYFGSNYRGFANTTKSGKTCQKWTSQSPHEHTKTPTARPGFGLGDHNYCRNPDGEDAGTWCYTMDEDSRYEYCYVPYCDQDWGSWLDTQAALSQIRLGHGLETAGCYNTKDATDTATTRKLELKMEYNKLTAEFQSTEVNTMTRPDTLNTACAAYTSATMPTTISFNANFENFPSFYYEYRVGMY